MYMLRTESIDDNYTSLRLLNRWEPERTNAQNNEMSADVRRVLFLEHFNFPIHAPESQLMLDHVNALSWWVCPPSMQCIVTLL
jgi:hypothetical protein